MNKKNLLPWIAFLILIFIGTMSKMVRFFTDYLWFGEMGYIAAFLVKLLTYLKIGVPVFLLSTVIFFIYLKALRKRFEKVSMVILDKASHQRITGALNLGAAVLGLIYSYIFTTSLWFDWLSFVNRTPFGKADPLFGMDISFYFFVLPLMREFLGMGLLLLFVLVGLTVLLMVLLSNIPPKTGADDVFDINEFRFRNDIRSILNRNIFANSIVKIGILGSLALVLIAVNNVISVYSLVYSPRGAAFGASYTDVHISLPGYWILAVIALLGAGLFLFGALQRKWRFMIIGPAVLLVAAVGISLTEAVVQSFIVNPNERAAERPFITMNIQSTQDAFNFNDIETLEFPAEGTLTREDLKDNADIINNIRINDFRPLLMTVNQLQGIRLYYEFNDVDVDRYMINGEYRQVFIAAREMNQDKLEQKTWVNTRLQFTHGYGVALAPVNEVTVEGQPSLMVKDIPPVSLSEDLKITRPEIYFGELTNNFIIVNAKEKEFDYPKGADNVYVNYEGPAGITLNFANKVLFSVRERTINPLISNALDAESRIILNRNIVKRAQTLMPWLNYEQNPYIIINQEDGKLYWILDAYTISKRYPYSQPAENGVNYIRNSVKVVIDAYSGETNFYIYDKMDPVVLTYQKIFPGLFKPSEAMSAGIARHIRYPKDLLDIQASIYEKYHVTNPDVFYNGEDIWDIAQEKYMQDAVTVEANYVMYRLPDESEVEFILNIPFTPNEKSNMNALLMARSDGENYGKLFLYRFSKAKLIQGPQILESRIDQDTAISQQLTFWDQKGSSVLRGNLMTIPIKDSLLYVEPIYLQSSGERSLPEMKRVVVSYGNQVVMEETLQLALDRIFGADITAVPVDSAPAESSEGKALVDKAKGLIESSAKIIEELKTVMDQLNEIISPADQPATPDIPTTVQ